MPTLRAQSRRRDRARAGAGRRRLRHLPQLPHVTPALPAARLPGGHGQQAITLETGQAAIAATIAGVAARHRLPRQAVTIALAAALQESKLHNLDYGDRDSVGIFQQRPSQGWGPAAELEDPVYATTKFFAALTQVPGYATMPVYQAAQDVQHSADGSAYEQWAQVAGQLAGYFTGQPPHGVSCWYAPSGPGDLAGAVRRMAQTFGPQGQKAVVIQDHHGSFGPEELGKRRGPARPAELGLDGGQLAGGARADLRPERSTVCRL